MPRGTEETNMSRTFVEFFPTSTIKIKINDNADGLSIEAVFERPNTIDNYSDWIKSIAEKYIGQPVDSITVEKLKNEFIEKLKLAKKLENI